MSKTRRWLITGISSGIGQALAEAALERGDTVYGTARRPEDVAKFEARAPGRSKGVQLDVTRHADIGQVVERIVSEGPLDVVVANAGQSIFGALEETSVEEVKALFDVNVIGPWALAQAVLPHFRKQGTGQLVHMSSGCGLNGMAGLGAYCASKFALEGFSEALAQEVAQFGIRLLLVEPGAVATQFISHGTHEAARRMPEYGFLSGQGKSLLEGYYATSALPAQDVAARILAAIDNPDQPLRLLIGDDQRDSVRAKGEQITQLANA